MTPLLFLLVALASAQSSITAVLDVAVRNGAPQQLASGIIYGTPDVQNQIPDRFYTETKLKYFRAGGAQLFGVGQRGWHYNEYPARFQSTLSNYRTARKYGGEFQILPHDIWGTDTANSSTHWPGDNGDWSSYDRFLDRLIADIKANNMVPGLKIDIWNEPNLPLFWNRGLQQWLDLWRRTHQRFRADPQLRGVPLIGPSLTIAPTLTDPWWDAFMRWQVTQNVQADQYTIHLLGSTTDRFNDMQSVVSVMEQLYARTGAARKSYSVNEYINSGNERQNSANAWHIARLERYNASGLRANWLSTWELHDFLAELVWRPNANSQYQPNGAWHMYRYYAQSMTGTRLGTSGSPDGALDIFSTLASDGTVRILTGVRARTGTWEIEVRNLQALGFPANGQVTIRTLGFDDVGLRGVSNGPSDRGTYTHTYTNGVLRFPIYQTQADLRTAWAFEFRR
ncbi:uncharacterized protein J7T54_002737 [Emericellopsis cladophorae]|uniref:Uncharacterized protein n=1 Tax=Emericellopsis cladophorae TaxID=2686198 RepID=A0A9Q0BB43_9HYPO|nr:uncharacterized protein J7T54_002737 [Emericellopsis cladophorae]KAI6777664.1 hypothetical protein J7T54_002737 [Emericellopsis cladophorae]